MHQLISIWLSLLASGLAASIALAQEQDKPPRILAADPVKVKLNEDEVSRLLKERYNAALLVMQDAYKNIEVGKVEVGMIVHAGQRLRSAALELHDTDAKKLAFLKDYAELANKIEGNYALRWAGGKISEGEFQAAVYFRADAELELARAKRRAQQKKDR